MTMNTKLATDIVDMLDSIESEPRAAKIAFLARFLEPIPQLAREGETVFACLKRNRSGIDSGCLEFAIHHSNLSKLRGKERDEIRRLAVRLCESVDRAVGPKINPL